MEQGCDARFDFRGGFMRLPDGEVVAKHQMELDPVSPARMAVAEIVV